MMSSQDLICALLSCGYQTLLLPAADGAEIVVLPYGGRVLGVFPPDSSESTLYINPVLFNAENARNFFNQPGWHSTGGHRTWLAPEVALFYPKYPDMNQYIPPRELEPGNYRILRKNDCIELRNRASITHYPSGKQLELEILKEFAPRSKPLYQTEARYAGYTLSTTLLIHGDQVAPIGLWNIIQVPYGGTFLAPLISDSPARVFFGDIPESDLTQTDCCASYRMKASGIQKVAWQASASKGVMGHISEQDSQWSLVVCEFSLDPLGSYIDVPPNAPDETGYAVQACNIDYPGLGMFGEIEYHTPAIGLTEKSRTCTDICSVHTYRGSAQEIQEICEAHLGCSFAVLTAV